MKQITLNVPDDATVLEAQYELDRAFSPDWMSLQWHISDVQDCVGNDYSPMSDDDAREILRAIEHRHDASNGVNWDTINCHVDMWREHQEEDAFQILKTQREDRILKEEA
jgi:hypothetical protein